MVNDCIENEKRCDDISKDWNCSSGVNQHSICIRQCPADFHSESIKCKCKHQYCRWEQKGKPCTWARRLSGDQGSLGWDRPANSVQSGQTESSGFPETAPRTEQRLMNSIIDSVKGQSVFGDNFDSNFDIEQRNMQPEILNYTPGGPRAPRGMPGGARVGDSGPIESTEFGQNQDDFTQLLRDIKLSNTGHMVFNVNYFNNYASNSL